MYLQLILSLSSGLAPAEQIGIPILTDTQAIMKMKFSHQSGGLSKKEIIAQVVKEMPYEMDFTETELHQLYKLGVELNNNCLSKEELIAKINNLRAGSFVDVIGALGLIGVMIIVLTNEWGLAFQPDPNAMIPPHLQWLYGDNYKPGQFGYGKGAGPRRSSTSIAMTQSAGSEKKDPSLSGSYNYMDVIKKLDNQSSRKKVEIQVGDQIYTIKNPYRDDASELSSKLAEQIYDSIRDCDTDICDVAENLGFKADNIKKVKDHVFFNEHTLDRYGPDQIEHKRFDADLRQALAWKRLENGTHTQDDVTWIKHECAERHHESKYNSGYNDAHNRAQSKYDGMPWNNEF